MSAQRKVTTVDLDATQQANVRGAMLFLRTKFCGWESLSKLLHFDPTTLIHVGRGRRPVCASLAFRIARLVKIKVDDLLSGKFPGPGTCPHCGHHDGSMGPS